MDVFCRRGREAKAVISVKSVTDRHSLPSVNLVGRLEAGSTVASYLGHVDAETVVREQQGQLLKREGGERFHAGRIFSKYISLCIPDCCVGGSGAAPCSCTGSTAGPSARGEGSGRRGRRHKFCTYTYVRRTDRCSVCV